jgi:predicted Fe-S protein YdhL (DUF1289 family)
MFDTDLTAPQSPCTNVCRMHAPTGYCEGCARTLDEIIEWPRATRVRRHEILLALPQRHQALNDLAVKPVPVDPTD